MVVMAQNDGGSGGSSDDKGPQMVYITGELDINFFDEVANLCTVQSISLFTSEELG